MRAWCPACLEERTVPFRPEGVQRCGHCASILCAPPTERKAKPPRRRAVSTATGAQRGKVLFAVCLVCGDDHVDPAHLVPRGMGGCDHEDCVVPLCRRCHRLYDDGKLDLLPHLEPHWQRELGHAVTHLGLIATLERVTHERWRPQP